MNEKLPRSEICKRTRNAYILWAKGATPEHQNYSYYLKEARICNILYKFWDRIETEPTEEFDYKPILLKAS